MHQVGQLYEAINAVWREDAGGNLVALEHLKALVYEERERQGRLPRESIEPGAPSRTDLPGAQLPKSTQPLA